MIEATSGERFEDKAFNELEQMETISKRVYARGHLTKPGTTGVILSEPGFA
jgi:hypothetical protein